MALCTFQKNQAWFFEDNLLKTRSSGTICLTSSSTAAALASCISLTDNQQWYLDVFGSLRYPDVKYAALRNSVCGAGFMAELVVRRIEICAMACLSNSECGYFAFRNAGQRRDGKPLNCEIYFGSSGCPATTSVPQYNAFQLDRAVLMTLTTTTTTVKPVSPDKLRDCSGFNSGGKLTKGEETKEFIIFNNEKGIPVCKKTK
jgi:hypothetical protein